MLEIRRIEVYEVWVRLKSPFRTSFGVTRERPAILVRVEEKRGEEGWGEVVAGEGPWYSGETYETAWLVITKYLSGLIEKAGWSVDSARGFSKLAAPIRDNRMAKAGVEQALWDLEARLAGEPLWRHIGGVKGYVVSGVSIGIKDDVNELLRIVSQRLEEGYARIKLKIEPERDIAYVAAVRREYPDIPLQVDANAAYRLEHLHILRKLDSLDLLMIEQPLAYDDLYGHSILERKLDTPICLDESIRGVRDAQAAAALGAATYINIKPGRVGGIRESLLIHDYWWKSLNLPVWIGGMLETGVGRGHLVALGTLEGVRLPSDVSASDRYYDEDIVEPPWELRGGRIHAPEKPGIGVDVKTELVERLAKRKAVLAPR